MEHERRELSVPSQRRAELAGATLHAVLSASAVWLFLLLVNG